MKVGEVRTEVGLLGREVLGHWNVLAFDWID